MVPVDEGVIEPDAYALGPERVHRHPDEVLPVGGLRGLVIGVFGIKKAEALVVLRGHDEVFHPGLFRVPRPFLRVVQVGVEEVEIFLILFVRYALVVSDPFVTGGERVEAPVDEHAEPRLGPPLHPRLTLLFGFRTGRPARADGESRRRNGTHRLTAGHAEFFAVHRHAPLAERCTAKALMHGIQCTGRVLQSCPIHALRYDSSASAVAPR